MRAVSRVLLLGSLMASSSAFADTVIVKEARVWQVNDSKTMKRMGTDPRISVEVTEGKVAKESCAEISKGTKLARVLWKMKGKAYDFNLRAPTQLGDGTKKTIAGQLSVDASGKATVLSCELVEYEPAKDDPPEWPADPF